jgi:uncharacterized membrane protein YhhN
MKSLPLFSFLYFALLVLHLYAGQFGPYAQENSALFEMVESITKPLLVLSLLVWFGFSAKHYHFSKFAKWLIVGMVFCLIGDVLLMFQEEDGKWFTWGLGAFLVGHIAYSTAFTRTHRRDHEVALLKQKGWLLVLVAGYAVYFFSRISPSLGPMIAPVMLYTVVISVMVLLALNRYGKVCDRSFWPIAAGASIFVVSDSLLAWNKFVSPMDYSHIYIMASYGTAQFLIAVGGVFQVIDQARDEDLKRVETA